MSAVPNDDVYKVTLKGVLNGAQMMNVFHYYRLVSSGNANELRDAFMSSVYPRIKDVTSGAYRFVELQVANLNDASDSAIEVINEIGNRGTTRAPDFTAWGFRIFSDIVTGRGGSKRFPGVCDSDENDGNPSAAMSLLLATLATTLSSLISSGVLSQYGYTVHQTSIVAGIKVPLWRTISGVAFRWMTTQNTRKPGRGI